MFSLEDNVTASKTGKDGRLKLVSFIDLMQDCSQLWLSSESVFENYFKENNLSQLLASRQIDILRVPQYGEKLTTTTSIFECQNLYGYRNTVIYDQQNKPCALSWSMGAFVSLETGRMTKVPTEILNTVKNDEKVEMEYLERKIIISDNSKFRDFPVFDVLRNDIDMNKHMNNAQYVRLAVECLPEYFKPKRLRIEYKLPAKLGDKIYPCVSTENDQKIIIVLQNAEKKPYSILEFIQ